MSAPTLPEPVTAVKPASFFNVGKRQFMALLAVSSIVLLIVFFVLLGDFWVKNLSPQNPQVDFAQLNYPDSYSKGRIEKLLADVTSEKNPQKHFEIYSEVFSIVNSIYIRDHDPKTREITQKVADFILQTFPQYANKADFTVDCLDFECGEANYPPEISTITADLSAAKEIDPEVQGNILRRFEAAALSSNETFKWNQYFGAFQILRAEGKRTKAEGVIKQAGELRDFLKNKYPELYTHTESVNAESLAI